MPRVTLIPCLHVSSFGGRGKKTAWETWAIDEISEITEAFCALAATPMLDGLIGTFGGDYY